ncbi:MAG: Girdin [Geoglossum umbratile]|nr:MAG: Girdin [Geoglossum umbratile]
MTTRKGFSFSGKYKRIAELEALLRERDELLEQQTIHIGSLSNARCELKDENLLVQHLRTSELEALKLERDKALEQQQTQIAEYESLSSSLLERDKLLEQQEIHITSLLGALSELKDEKLAIQRLLEDSSEISEAEWQRLRQEAQELKKDMEILNASNEDIRGQLSEALAACCRLEAEKKELDGHLVYLQNVLSAGVRANRSLKTEKEGIQNRLAYLEQVIAQVDVSAGGVESLFDDKKRLEKDNQDLTTTLKAQDTAIAELRLNLATRQTQSRELEQSSKAAQAEASVLRENLPQTLRSLLITRVIDCLSQAPLTGNGVDEEWSPADLSPRLDDVCDPAGFQLLTERIPRGRQYFSFYRRITIETCRMCAKPKFKFVTLPQNTSLEWLNEFPRRSSYF